MSGDPESDLRQAFRALRAHHEVGVPDFESLQARDPVARSRSPWWASRRFGWAAGLAMAASLGAWLALQPQPVAVDAAAIELPAWPRSTEPLLVAAVDPFRRRSWTELPTNALGRSSSSQPKEVR